MNDDYMSEADNEVDGGYFADLEYAYQQKEIRRQEDKENKAKKEENRKQQLLMQNKCIENLKAKLERKNQQLDQLKQQLDESFTEEDVKGLIEDRDKTIKFLQQELAEKDKLIEFGREEIRKRNKRIDEIVERDKKLFDDKNKEIELYYNFLCNIADLIKTDVETLLFTNGNIIIQNQTQLAIQELEKVKEKIDCEMAIREYNISEQTADVCVSIAEQIDQQIKELKGEKDVED